MSKWIAPEIQPTLDACQTCGATVLVRLASWDERGLTDDVKKIPKVTRVPVYRELALPLDPVTGSVHACDTGLALQAIAQSTRWNAVRTCTPQIRRTMRYRGEPTELALLEGPA